MTHGSFLWRSKLGAFCRLLHLNPDNYKKFFKEWFGKNWVYHLGPVIGSIKLPEFHTEAESKASLWCAWIYAVKERERRSSRKRRDDVAAKFPTKPALNRGSWIERTLKED